MDVAGETGRVDHGCQLRGGGGISGRGQAPHGSVPAGERGVPSRQSQHAWPEPILLHGRAQHGHDRPLWGRGAAGNCCCCTRAAIAEAAVTAAVAAAAGRSSPPPREGGDVARLHCHPSSPLPDGDGGCCNGEHARATYYAWRMDPSPPVGSGGWAAWPPLSASATAVSGPKRAGARRAAVATAGYCRGRPTWAPSGWGGCGMVAAAAGALLAMPARSTLPADQASLFWQRCAVAELWV